jgi:hypothetical protein
LFDPLAAPLPTALVPMTAQVGGVAWHAYDVAGALWNSAVAPWANIFFVRFVRLHAPHFDGPIQAIPHRWFVRWATAGHARKAQTTSALMTVRAPTITA